MGKLAEVCVAASCGHVVWVAIRDSTDRHNAERIADTKSRQCPDCRVADARMARLPERAAALRRASEACPRMPDMPAGDITISPTDNGWLATLPCGASGWSQSPTGAVLVAFAAHLESELESQ